MSVFKTWNFFFLLSAFLVVQPSFSADAKKGQSLYKSCVQCHGEDGRGNPAEKAPKIAGQFDWYIVSSIKALKAGKERNRKNCKIKSLSDEDIENLATYISGLKP